MLKTDDVVELLKKTGPIKFSEIWKELGEKIIEQISIVTDDAKLQADLLVSMSKDERLVILSNDEREDWDLRENYSYEEFKALKSKAIGEELKKIENILEDEDEDL